MNGKICRAGIRAAFAIVLTLCMLCMCAFPTALGDETATASIELTNYTLSELNALNTEIDEALKLYHTPLKTVQDSAFAATKEAVGAYYGARGIEVTWPWFPNEYVYTRAWDMYMASTHIDYKDTSGEQRHADVYAELFPVGYRYEVYYLRSGEDTIIDRRGELPAHKWVTAPEPIIGDATGLNVAEIPADELNALKAGIASEIALNHTTVPATNDLVCSLAKTVIENHFSQQGIAITWPWTVYEFAYTNDRNLYSLTTHIDYKDASWAGQRQDVYAEAYPGADGEYSLVYLKVGEQELINLRATLPANLSAGATVTTPEPTAAPTPTPAPTAQHTQLPTLAPDVPRYYMGSAVNAGTDTGYSQSNAITGEDPHFGWRLGRFFVSGYTSVTENETPVFIKTLGDTVTLWFSLEQDIDALNGSANAAISGDANGYDEYFGIPRTDFGRGALIVRHRDFQNRDAEPAVYVNYLSAELSAGADTQVRFCEEGDYEIALDYEIRDKYELVGVQTFDRYNNYRIFFKFSVRNGNCMVYPFDVLTGAELTNAAVTENGFYLDLARSRYLDINIRRETLAEGAAGFTEDVRFNRPAKDGDRYTDEGIYTITVSNRYTGQQTVKKIYVGTNPILIEYVTTGKLGTAPGD